MSSAGNLRRAVAPVANKAAMRGWSALRLSRLGLILCHPIQQRDASPARQGQYERAASLRLSSCKREGSTTYPSLRAGGLWGAPS